MHTTEFQTFRERYRKALSNNFGETNVCPFWGDQDAKIVSISQAPSASVIKHQRPFSDKSGEKLRNKWYRVSDEIFYDPTNFYFTAIGMYYPGRNKKGGDLKPLMEFAKKWLPLELSYLNPRLYLIVGGLASSFFFPKTKLTDLVMTDQAIDGVTAIVLPHPSPINVRWFMKNPQFEKNRTAVVRRHVHNALKI